MLELFKEIFESRSFLYIEMLLEREIPKASGKDLETLQAMSRATCLDDIHALAADALGLTQQAADIRAFRARKLTQPRVLPDYLLI